MADDRVVKVVLSAEVREYLRGMEEASEKTKQAAAEAKNLKDRADALETVGKYAVAFGAAMSVAAGAVAKTGIEYNTLQQTSRAALSTLLGGAEAANEQMDKLDEFATTSPFSKAVFIDAQQQLLGFGTEAERVVPILDAIQNAVAATGGSNEDIAELVRIIAQLEGGVKLSAETFNQFGTRGIDAAQLIGDAMGKTGAQIREEVTAGTLDADEAIQALTDGMSARFSGAAENVKNTFDGAMDRVKAAWRDVAADLMTPLVDPNGGGFLIDAANGVADLMRQFEALPDSVKNTIGIMGGLAGATALVGGTAILAVPKILDFVKKVELLTGATTLAGKGVLALKAAAGGLILAGGIAALMEWSDAAHLSAENTEKLKDEILGAADSADVLATALKGTQEADAEGIFARGSGSWDLAKEELEDLAGLMDDARHFNTSNLWENLTDFRLNHGAQAAYDTLKNIGTELAGLASENLPAAQKGFQSLGEGLDDVQLSQLLREVPAYRDALSELAEENGIAAKQGNLLAIATGDVSYASDDAKSSVEGLIKSNRDSKGASEDAADGLSAIEEGAKAAQERVDELAGAIRGFGSETLSVRDAHRKFEESIDDLAQSIEDNGTSLDRSTEAGRANEAAIDAIAESTLELAASTFEMTGNEEDAARVIGDGREALIKKLEAFGLAGDAAREYADELGLIPENVDTIVDLQGVDEAEEKLKELVRHREAMVTVRWDEDGAGGSMMGGRQVFANADGGLYDHTSGIYTGGDPLYKFAEPETGWEAFISGKPSERDRNVGIWQQAGERLGVAVGGASSAPSVTVQQHFNLPPGFTAQQIEAISGRGVQKALR